MIKDNQRNLRLESEILHRTGFASHGTINFMQVQGWYNLLSVPVLSEIVSWLNYDKLMEKWDNRRHFILSNMMLQEIGNKKEIIDFCCGTGLAGIPFIKKGYMVDGIDLSKNMLRRAKKRGYRKIHNIDIIYESIGNGELYDAAICCGAIGNVLTPEIVIPKMSEALKKEAVLGMTLESMNPYELKLTRETLSGCGFNVLRQEIDHSDRVSKCFYIAAERK